ncbi:type II restriction endonuclease [uncultured Rummeliibacillus sp.]|uniref:type II restriction endonuclease n=1 Tax=uncultured Rummeliibacillus sp. TaxID=762292 RepID=UPI0026180B8E|nr:type II restriction endonuclease [uncultured Rummeliibacillus sp.]
MKFEEYANLSPDKRLAYFMDTLSVTNRTPEYYVNWEKVNRETKKYELELNTLNYLIGKENIYQETLNLFTKQPDLIKALPSLIASRDKILDVLSIDENDSMSFYQLDFKDIDINNIKSYVDFAEQSGLLNFLENEANRSLVDYVYGVEAGLDSNGRKNRSGTTMEGILERNVAKVANKLSLEHHPQATAKWILSNWGIHVPVDKSERRFDDAVFDPNTNRLWLIETNYYGGGGSKLKAVAGEFTTLNEFVSNSADDVTFVWVTDGQGWHTAHLPLEEAFGHISYVFNLNMLSENYLFELFN